MNHVDQMKNDRTAKLRRMRGQTRIHYTFRPMSVYQWRVFARRLMAMATEQEVLEAADFADQRSRSAAWVKKP